MQRYLIIFHIFYKSASLNILAKCSKCCRIRNGPCPPDAAETFLGVKCQECCKWFTNEECYKFHKKGPCQTFKKCEKCNHVYRVNNLPHRCGDEYCKLCQRIHNSAKGCYIQPIQNKNDNPVRRIIIFDLEVICFY